MILIPSTLTTLLSTVSSISISSSSISYSDDYEGLPDYSGTVLTVFAVFSSSFDPDDEPELATKDRGFFKVSGDRYFLSLFFQYS